jgi:hypothetical protein
MPFLAWNFEILRLLGRGARVAATLFVVAGAALLTRLIVRRYASADGRPQGAHEAILDGTTFGWLLQMLVFFQIGDEYLLVFLPYAAIATGRALRSALQQHARLVAAAGLFLLAGSAVWTREDLARHEAIWSLAEGLHDQGVPPERIFAGWEWAGYYRFDEYARATPPTAHVSFEDFFDRWVPQQRDRAECLIVHNPEPPPGDAWQLVARADYFSVFSRGRESFYAVRRLASSGADKGRPPENPGQR